MPSFRVVGTLLVGIGMVKSLRHIALAGMRTPSALSTRKGRPEVFDIRGTSGHSTCHANDRDGLELAVSRHWQGFLIPYAHDGKGHLPNCRDKCVAQMIQGISLSFMAHCVYLWNLHPQLVRLRLASLDTCRTHSVSSFRTIDGRHIRVHKTVRIAGLSKRGNRLWTSTVQHSYCGSHIIHRQAHVVGEVKNHSVYYSGTMS